MAYIELTKGGTDSRVKSTISCWVKRGLLGSEQYIWGWGEANNSDAYLRFDAGDNIECNIDGAGSNFNSTRLFRDTNAWYHFVVSLDGSNATANLRRRIWVNGEQLDDGNSAIGTFSSAVMGWLSTQDLWIGSNPRSQNGSNIRAFDGYISHFHYCDGYSYGASDFGETDATTGEWKIIASPSVNYGASGFFLKMENGSNMDQDSSGNNKTLVTNGTINLSQDNPSNSFATGNPHYWTASAWNSASLTNGNNVFGGSLSTDTYAGIWSSIVMPRKGKYYTEFKITAGSSSGGNAYVGIATPESVNETSNAGKYSGYTNMGGNHGHEYSIYGSDGQKYVKENGGTQTGSTYGSNVTFGTNDIICIACDLDNNKLYFRKNGDAWLNSGNPESGSTGTGALSIINHDYHMFICDGGGGTFINADANFGNGYFGTTAVSSAGTNASNNGIFEYDVPAGYTALCTKGINSF